MLRKTAVSRGFRAPMTETSPIIHYSFFHWHYLFPQGMEAPNRSNRTVELPHPRTPTNKFRGVWIDTEIHPSLRIALDPYLAKLPLGRVVPRTPIEEAVADFTRISGHITDVPSRQGWLAKVMHLAAIHKRYDAVKGLWEAEHAACVEAATSPALPLLKAALLCMASSGVAEWRQLFDRCLKDGYNVTPRFDSALWAVLTTNAGNLGDEAGVVALLEEAIDVQADIDRWYANSLVIGLNALKSPAQYNFAKKFLFALSEEKTQRLAKVYTRLRSTESDAEGALPENDAMYYHVTWHARIRGPQHFSPRQLYFDYKPSAATSGYQDPNAKMKDIIADKIAKWKEEGLLPEDYVHEDKFFDNAERYRSMLRSEFWVAKEHKWAKKKKLGYTQGVSAAGVPTG